MDIFDAVKMILTAIGFTALFGSFVFFVLFFVKERKGKYMITSVVLFCTWLLFMFIHFIVACVQYY